MATIKLPRKYHQVIIEGKVKIDNVNEIIIDEYNDNNGKLSRNLSKDTRKNVFIESN